VARSAWLLIALLLTLSLAACRTAAPLPETAVALADAAPAADAVQPSPTLPNPAAPTAVATVALVMPSFAPATPTATLAATHTPPPTPTADPVEAAPPSPTPAPTFTPPALPYTQPWEHYWLRRPVPEGSSVWTDKAYPYGSTRGGTLRPHHGVEFYVPSGTEVLAAASGIVRVAGNDAVFVYGPHANFYGNLVIIELDARWDGRAVYTLYAHLSEALVSEGQTVAAQELIARSGATGVADGPHLHFEVRVGQNSYSATRNPLLWLYPFPNRGVVAGRVLWPNGAPVHEAPLQLRRIDAPSPYAATSTYAQGDLNGDEHWNENFAFDDVAAGYYEIEVQSGGKKLTETVWVYPYQTSFVEIVLDGGQ
jgi:murein DD-endopeptidase MepM/ murein hydrolase activator NlpD